MIHEFLESIHISRLGSRDHLKCPPIRGCHPALFPNLEILTQPGKPMQNAHVESFHGRLREECLAVSWFPNLFDARRKIAATRIEYNEERAQQPRIQKLKSSRRRKQQASTQLSEGQATQTPSLAPGAPPPRLNPERE